MTGTINAGEQGIGMLHLASYEFTGLRILIVENDIENAVEITTAIEAAGAIVAGCVATGLAAISYVNLWKVDTVVVHTETLKKIPFDLHKILTSLGIALFPVTSFDDWFDFEEEEFDMGKSTAKFGVNKAA